MTKIVIESKIKLQSSQTNFDWIDILRGLASLGVVLFHSRVFLWVGWNEITTNSNKYNTFDSLVAWFSIPLPFLGSAVMLFFLLSGFCIHYPNIEKNEINIMAYGIRRFIRIVPPYWLAILFTFIIEYSCNKYFLTHVSNKHKIIESLLMIQNYPPNSGQLASNPSLWSLPVEMELYILYPIIFFFFRRIGYKFVLLAVTIISLGALFFALTSNPWMQANFLKHWIVWCLGALIAYMIKTNRFPKWNNYNTIFILSALFLSIGATLANISFPIRDYIWTSFYFLLLWFCLTLSSPIKYFKKGLLKILSWLGKISFSLYLIHFPIFYLLGSLWVFHFGGKPTNLLVCYLATLLAIFMASLFYLLFEKPFHILARNLGKVK